MQISNPLSGHFEYTEYFHMAWLWNTNIQSALMIGLALGIDRGMDSGRLQEARSLLLKLGTRKIGAPDAGAMKAIESEPSLIKLEEMTLSVNETVSDPVPA